MRPNEMPDLPMSDAGITGGNYGKPVSTAALKRGFTVESESNPLSMSDSDGTTYEGDRATFGGVVGRPTGWDR